MTVGSLRLKESGPRPEPSVCLCGGGSPEHGAVANPGPSLLENTDLCIDLDLGRQISVGDFSASDTKKTDKTLIRLSSDTFSNLKTLNF